MTEKQLREQLEEDKTPTGKLLGDICFNLSHGNEITKVEPIEVTQYQADCDYLVDDRILSRELLMQLLAVLRAKRQDFEKYYPRDNSYYLCIIPTDVTGNELTPEAIEGAGYLWPLREDGEGLTHGFYGMPGPFLDALPSKMRELCLIAAKQTETTQGGDIFFVLFYNNMINAFNENRKFLGLPALELDDLYIK
ncbi:hypothetical protein ACFL2V_04375 [Pseudomonadota bacterium]